VQTVDVSLGGARVYSDTPMRVGSYVALDFLVPDTPHVTFTAQVMWVEELAAGARAHFDMGLRFLQLDAEAMTLLLHVLGSENDWGPPSDRTTLRVGDDPVEEMRESFSLGDYARALTIADRIMSTQPNHPIARTFRADGCAALEDVYAFRLGPMDRIPVVAKVPALTDPLFAKDHRSGFLLSLIDGSSTLETIIESCGMPRLDALRLLYELLQRGVVGFK
jgi:hypothetical protein